MKLNEEERAAWDLFAAHSLQALMLNKDAIIHLAKTHTDEATVAAKIASLMIEKRRESIGTDEGKANPYRDPFTTREL